MMNKHLLLALMIGTTPIFADQPKAYVVDLYNAVKQHTGLMSYIYNGAEKRAVKQALADGQTLETVYWQAIEYANNELDEKTATALTKSFSRQHWYGTPFWIGWAIIGASTAYLLTLSARINRAKKLADLESEQNKRELVQSYQQLCELRQTAETNERIEYAKKYLEQLLLCIETSHAAGIKRTFQTVLNHRESELVKTILLDEMLHLYDSPDWWNKHLSTGGIKVFSDKQSSSNGARNNQLSPEQAHDILAREWTALCSEKPELLSMGPLTPNASATEVRERYKKLALRWHPDKNKNDPAAAEHFKKIKEAAETLG